MRRSLRSRFAGILVALCRARTARRGADRSCGDVCTDVRLIWATGSISAPNQFDFTTEATGRSKARSSPAFESDLVSTESSAGSVRPAPEAGDQVVAREA
jgi:hypothetical protein